MVMTILHYIEKVLRDIFTETRCLIWRDFKAQIKQTASGSFRVKSQRAGGRYEITVEDADELVSLDDRARARLTTWIVNEQSSGVRWPNVTRDVICAAIEAPPLSPAECADRLLRYMADRIRRPNVSTKNRFVLRYRARPSRPRSVYPMAISPETRLALARSESVSFDDIRTLIDYLQRREWIIGEFGEIDDEGGNYVMQSNVFHCRVTVEGYSHLENLAPNANSSQIFVAMWLDTSVDAVFDKGIKPAINAAGYDEFRVDRTTGIDKIDDAVREEIRRSRLLIADVTHGENGQRGSVYYEIGIAHGIGIPVIFTCREDLVINNQLPFDTRQHTHIQWRTNQEHELINSLRSEIIERVGLAKHD